MRLSAVLAGLAVTFGFPAVSAAQDDNPYKKAKVGDFFTYKMTTKIAGISTEGTMTQSVVAIAADGKEATIALSGKLLVNGQEAVIPPKNETIDLTKHYDPTKASGQLPPGAEVKVEKVKDGTENLTLAKTKYAANWQTYKMNMKYMGNDFTADLKVWQVKDSNIPMVKMEMSSDVMGSKVEVLMELTETGNKPVEKPPEKTPEKK
jgi:hypothetical protein